MEPAAVLEVGPAVIRLLGGPEPDIGLRSMAAAALCGIDDPVTLHEGRPVRTERLLRDVVARAIGGPAPAVTVVHPTWWPRPRVSRLLRAVAATAVTVTSVGRADWIRRHDDPSAVVIEIDDAVITVSTRSTVTVCRRAESEAVLATVLATVAAAPSPATVLLDAADAERAAEILRDHLGDNGIGTRVVGLPAPPEPKGEPLRRSRRPVVAATVILTAVLGAWPLLHRAHHERVPDSSPLPAAVSLVEGRVAVRVPAGWPVRRVTGGPGSRRVEISSPSDPSTVLHLTQSRAPAAAPADAVAALRRAVAAQPEVFGGFRADAESAGRPAVTYTETRPGKVVLWTVVWDGSTRISVGCQNPPGRRSPVEAACLQAVTSAREIPAVQQQGH